MSYSLHGIAYCKKLQRNVSYYLCGMAHSSRHYKETLAISYAVSDNLQNVYKGPLVINYTNSHCTKKYEETFVVTYTISHCTTRYKETLVINYLELCQEI